MKELIEVFSYAGVVQNYPQFMTELGIDFYDIAYYDSKWWYACNDPQYPIRVYNGNGTLVESISSSVLPAAHGITFDGNGYLWVSNKNADKIYKIENTSSLNGVTWGSIKSSF